MSASPTSSTTSGKVHVSRHLGQPVDIVHVIGALAAGGAERFVVDLLVRLKALGLNVGLLALSARHDSAGAKMNQLLRKENIPFAFGPTDRVRGRSVLWYFQELRSTKPSVVHLHTENTELAHYLCTRIYRRKHTILRTVHNTNIRLTFLNALAMNRNMASLSIGCGDAVKHEVLHKLRGPTMTITNGINFDWPIQTSDLKAEYKRKLSLSAGSFHFVQVGRQTGESVQSSQKGIDILIHAWKTGAIGRQNAILHLLGDGNLGNQFRALAGTDDSIVFHGIQPNIHDWLLAADCFVMPSRYEGLPIAGIEAVGTGVRCIFSDIPPLRELGSPAVLWSQVGNVEQLVENLNAAIDWDAAVPIEATRAIRKRFGIELTAEQYRQCYRDYT